MGKEWHLPLENQGAKKKGAAGEVRSGGLQEEIETNIEGCRAVIGRRTRWGRSPERGIARRGEDKGLPGEVAWVKAAHLVGLRGEKNKKTSFDATTRGGLGFSKRGFVGRLRARIRGAERCAVKKERGGSADDGERSKTTGVKQSRDFNG